jgi:hypothetical protein
MSPVMTADRPDDELPSRRGKRAAGRGPGWPPIRTLCAHSAAGQSGLALALGTRAHHVPREPTGLQARMTSADGSSCQRSRPWHADVGKPWWLLCQDSPKEGSASQNTLRDSSDVRNRRRPKTWQIELMLNVT